MMNYQHIKKALIVEDDPSIRMTLKAFLEFLDLQPIEVSNGEEAIKVFKQNKVDLLITDFRMPKMDGVQLLNWCRTHQIHIPVIFMSANANLVQREQVALADCCATLMFKPINLDVFTAAVGAADSRNHHRDCVHLRGNPVK